jgi:hypothetical protein
MHMSEMQAPPGSPCTMQLVKHAASSHGCCGVSQTPLLHVWPDAQSAALQHWAEHWHWFPTGW